MKSFLFFLFLISATAVSAQNLTTSQLIMLSDKNLGEVEEYLRGKSWYFFEGNDETDKKLGNTKFVYNRPDFGPGSTAEYFITYFFSELQDARFIQILFWNKATYDQFTTQLKNLKFKPVSSSTKDGNIVKVFKHNSDMVEVLIPPRIDGTNGYRISFYDKSSYKKLN